MSIISKKDFVFTGPQDIILLCTLPQYILNELVNLCGPALAAGEMNCVHTQWFSEEFLKSLP